jgi:hypothetical protein
LWDRIEDLNNGGFLVHRNRQGVKMNKKLGTAKAAADKLVKTIRRKSAPPRIRGELEEAKVGNVRSGPATRS